MEDSAAQIDLIIESLQRSQVSRYANVAAACLFIYDYVLTLPSEIILVWSGPWGPGKALFLLTRYMTWPEVVLAVYQQTADIPAPTCHAFFTYFAWSFLWGLAASEMILILRTWAIWNRKRVVLLGLIGLLVALWVPNSYFANIVIKETTFVASSSFSPALSGCFVTGSTKLLSINWILLTTMDFVILCLTIVQGIQQFRFGSSTLLTSLYRDGVLYFVYLFGISLANVIVLCTTAPEYTILLNQIQRVLHAMLSCRIILGLRAIAARFETQAYSSREYSIDRSWVGGGEHESL